MVGISRFLRRTKSPWGVFILLGLLAQPYIVYAYIPVLSELVVASVISNSLSRSRERRYESRERRRFERVEEDDYRESNYSRNNSSRPAREVEAVQSLVLSDKLEDYLGKDFNRAAKQLLTCVVDLAEADPAAHAASMNKFLGKPVVVDFFRAFANPNVDFTPLAEEMPFSEALSKLGAPGDVVRAKINWIIEKLGGDQRALRSAAKAGKLNAEFLKGHFGTRAENSAALKDTALDFAAWSQISPRAMILKGFTPDEKTKALEAKENQKLEYSGQFLTTLLSIYTQYLPEAKREQMSKALLDAKEKNLDFTETIVLILKQAGPVVLKRLQEGDVAVPELQKALRIFLDNVPPMEWEKVESIVLADHQLNELSDAFLEFEKTPIATGTVAQVHRAKVMVDGKPVEVAVKVWRPGFDDAVSEDLAVLERGKKHIVEHLNPKAFNDYISHIRKVLRREGDPQLEADNIQTAAKVYDRPEIGLKSLELVPVHGRSHTRYTLITKFVDGTTLARVDRKSKSAILRSIRELSKVYTHWLHVALDMRGAFAVPGFMHGDLHPGNIKAENTVSTYLDFGSVAQLTIEQRQGLTAFFRGFMAKDPALFIEGINTMLGKDQPMPSQVEEAVKKSIANELKLEVPMSEVLEAIHGKLAESNLSLFSGFFQFKRVVAQVENELRSLQMSYEANVGSGAKVSAIKRSKPAAIYEGVLSDLAPAASDPREECAKKLTKK